MTGAVHRQPNPYGLWASPLTPQAMAEGLRLTDLAWDTAGGTLVWLEGRGDQGVLVCAPANGDAPRDLTGDRSVRAQVGYGGGDFTVSHGQVYYVEQSSGRLYRQSLAPGAAQPLTPAFGHAAAPAVSPDGRWLVYVHSYEGVDRLAIVDTLGEHWPQWLASGADFYMQPRWHPSGTQLAWIAWDQPQMPWDGTRLYLADVHPAGDRLPALGEPQLVAGSATVAIFQPEFSPDGRALAYITNESGWENLYLYDLASGEHRVLTNEQADLGTPAWLQGRRTYFFGPNGRALYFLRNDGGVHTVWGCDLHNGTTRQLAILADYTWIEQPAVAPDSGELAVIASSATIPKRVVTLGRHGNVPRVRARSVSEAVAPPALATPRPVSWTTADGATAHGLYYPPTGDSGTRSGLPLPPAIVRIHGGPTSQATTVYSPEDQFFATRGYAVLEVNYRGSTGYGRDYVQALRGNWGIYDVEDAVSGARYLVTEGLADERRLVIAGGSAGGYTVLQTLIHHPGVFKAALCLYGVSNLFTLAADTHKFEARYLDSLIGPLPEAQACYRERSPLFYADQIQDPIAIFQGDSDRVVPPDQSEAIVAALRRRGVPHEYHLYAGEGHGWRKRETVMAFFTAVERFLRQYVIFS